MRGVRRVVVGMAAVAMAAIGVGIVTIPAGAGAETAGAEGSGHAEGNIQRNVPEVIRVPAGNKQIAVMQGRGVQTYRCVNGVFTFVQPDAILQRHGRAEVLHSAGPVWTSVLDGSSVGAAVDTISPVPNAIPQLRLKATTHRGPGLFAEVTFVQRLNTTGGLAPTGSCTEGVTASIPYTSDYTFWVATTS